MMTSRLVPVLQLLLLLPPSAPMVAQPAPRPSSCVVRLERASRELAATFIFEGLLSAQEPLHLFDDPLHQAYWFEPSTQELKKDLEDASANRVFAPAPKPTPKKRPKPNSPLLAARAERERVKTRLPPPTLQTAPPIPEGAVPVEDERSAPDRRGAASRALVKLKLSTLAERRETLEQAVSEMLDPLAAPKLPAFDVAVLLLFLSEIESGVPVPVACKEAAELSLAYSGDDQQSFRHVQGVLGAYARERLGME